MTSKDEGRLDQSSIEEFLRKKAEIEETIRERFQRPVTMMFTDIAASTEFFETHGDLEGRSMVQRHNDLLFPVIEKHHGRILKGLGDGLMVSFESPPAATRAAMEIQGLLETENRGKKPENQIWVKIAIHHGMGIVEKDDVYGDVVNTTARISSLAQRGEILVSQIYLDTIREENDIPHDYLGAKTLKGKTAPVDVHRIIWNEAEPPDRRRSVTAEPTRSQGEDAALHLHWSLEAGQLRVSAYLAGEQAQTVKHEESYPYPEAAIRKQVQELNQSLLSVDQRGRLTKEDFTHFRNAAAVFHKLLVSKDLHDFIVRNPSKTLVLKLDDHLAYIPWELLYDGDEFLCLKYSMGKLISTSRQPLAPGKDINRGPLRMLIVANPQGNLSATKTEGKAVEKELHKESASLGVIVELRGREASCEFLRARLRDYDLFHYAGHSDYHRADPSRSGLLLADGRFEVGQLLNLAREHPLPSLVFANACQSGRTEQWASGEDLHGLASAFLASGVRHYIGSTLDLFDRSSATFAEEFYRSLTQNRTIGEALRQARLASIAHYGRETLTWASYVLYGEPSFLYFSRRIAPTKPEHRQEPRKSYFLQTAALMLLGVLAVSLVSLFSIGRHGNSTSNEDDLARRAFQLIHEGQVAQAEALLHSVEGRSQSYHQAMLAVSLNRGNTDKVEQMLSQHQGERKPSVYDTVLKANLALSRGSLEESESLYRMTLAGSEAESWQKAECHYGLGRVYFKKDAFHRAIEEFDRALDLDPAYLQAYTAKGMALMRTGKIEGALDQYEKGATVNEADPINRALYRRTRDLLADRADSERRAKTDVLVSDLLKAYREGPRPTSHRDEWSSTPLYLFFLDLETKGQPAPREGEDLYFLEQIVREVTDSSRFHPVERILLERIMEELKLSSTQLADPSTALRLGKILSARLLTSGTVLRYKGQIQISLRAIDTETTRVAVGVSETCQAGDDPVPMLHKLAREFKSRMAKAYPIRGRVIQVEGDEATLDVGSLMGVAPGTTLRVMEKEGRDITLTVKDIEDRSCLAVPSGDKGVGKTLQKGWRVQEG